MKYYIINEYFIEKSLFPYKLDKNYFYLAIPSYTPYENYVRKVMLELSIQQSFLLSI